MVENGSSLSMTPHNLWKPRRKAIVQPWKDDDRGKIKLSKL